MKRLLYFGCIGDKGHFLWISEGFICYSFSTVRDRVGVVGVHDGFLRCIDGVYVPAITDQGVYRESIVPPFRIVAWHDYTVDSRPGSNSALLGVGYASAAEMIEDAPRYFPSVMNRQRKPLVPEPPL